MLEYAVVSGAVALVFAEWEEIRTSFVFWSMFEGAILSSTETLGQL